MRTGQDDALKPGRKCAALVAGAARQFWGKNSAGASI